MPPTETVADAGLTATDATGTPTVIAEVALLPPLVAVIVADPTATPLTSPLGETVATVGALLVHVTTRSVRAFPLASRGVALNCTVPPTGTVADVGLITTEATGAFV